MIVNGGVDLSKKPIWIEAPHIFKHDGKYYLICAEGGTADQHSEVVFRSDSARGPYVPVRGQPDSHAAASRSRAPVPDHVDRPRRFRRDAERRVVGRLPRHTSLRRRHCTTRARDVSCFRCAGSNGWPIILTGTQTVPYVNNAPETSPNGTRSDSVEREFHVARRFQYSGARVLLDVHAHTARAVV